MVSRIQASIGRLSALLRQADGRSVELRRGQSIYLPEITAVPMDAMHQVIDDTGGYTEIEMTDWIFQLSELGNIRPRKGDLIVYHDGQNDQIFEILPTANRQAVERHDNAGVMLVAHTKQIQ